MTAKSNVREDLIEAGLALLREGGAEGLTLRRAAAKAGVSHAAPAHHFAGVGGLLTAMAIRAYDDFAAAMVAARDASAPDPASQLQGVGRGYLSFASTNSGLFHLLFTNRGVDRDDPEFLAASLPAFAVLREACLPFTGGEPDVAFEVAIWSMVHGYALLGLAEPDSPKRALFEPPDVADLIERFLVAHAAVTGRSAP